jgi:NitT/TauT family transport system substrate-binding protein
MGLQGCSLEGTDQPIGVAVEFMDHAAAAYVAQEKGWFEDAGLDLETYESYVTGMALASALAREDIDVAYVCLVPAINAYANAGVPIKIVAGTHEAGYGLVVDPTVVGSVKDLERPDVRVGCVREGGAVDILLRRTMDAYELEPNILDKVQRMNPPKMLLAIRSGQLDAAFLPEQWATLAEQDLGFKMLLTSQDVWPDMQGSVLVVRDTLIQEHPQIVRKLVDTTHESTVWINQHPREAADIVARQLSISGGTALPANALDAAISFEITPEVVRRSMDRLAYTTEIDSAGVQEMIDYMAALGYIESSSQAEDLLNLSFLP